MRVNRKAESFALILGAKPNHMKTIYIFLLTSLFLGLVNMASAQSSNAYDGDMLAYYLGKSAKSTEIKELKAHYHAEMLNETHYLSKGGIELILKKGVLSEINIYRKSAVYGTFIDKLPKGLRFGMSSSEAKNLLGKPSTSYTSGYCEFEMDNYVLSCWFEGGKLSQLGLTIKNL